jgi:prepilin-type N-terminal cleavage/methylation domain-containing protein
MNHKKSKQFIRAFTIIEILIVVGVISILAVALLVLINPAEAQRRTRDTKRLKDAQFIESIIKQYLDDGNTGFADANSGAGVCTTGTTATHCTTSGLTGDTAPCSGSTNWVGGADVNLCNYAKAVPVDPINVFTSTCVIDDGDGTLDSDPSLDTSNTCYLYYGVAVNGTNYEVNVRQESTTNFDKVVNDGGNSGGWYEISSGTADLIDDDLESAGSAISS